MTSRPCCNPSILLLALAAFAAPALAQTETAPEPPAAAAPEAAPDSAIPASLRDRILEVLQLTDSADLGRQMMDQMLGSLQASSPGVPAEFWTRLREEFTTEDLVELIVPIYARHFTEAELDALIAFYSSDHGRSIVRKMPQVMQESLSVGQQWGAGIAREVLARLEASGYRKSS